MCATIVERRKESETTNGVAILETQREQDGNFRGFEIRADQS
jgi:hypothetical protein